jgi:hypothetical protein
MNPKNKRKVSKGTGKRYASTKPKLVAETLPRVRKPEPSQAEKALLSAFQDSPIKRIALG